MSHDGSRDSYLITRQELKVSAFSLIKSLLAFVWVYQQSNYAEGGATEVYCNRAVCPSVCLLQVFLVAR